MKQNINDNKYIDNIKRKVPILKYIMHYILIGMIKEKEKDQNK